METDFNYATELTIRIDWSEIDIFEHVNNVMYFKYIQAARVHYWESLGFDESHKTTGIGPTLAAASCQFIKPLFYPGNVIIRTRVSFMKTTSFGLQHQLFNDKGVLVATAEDVIVMYNFQTETKTPISEKLRQKIEALEGHKFAPPANT